MTPSVTRPGPHHPTGLRHRDRRTDPGLPTEHRAGLTDEEGELRCLVHRLAYR